MLEKFTIFGIGGCGSNIAYQAAIQNQMQAICIDTDSIALENKEQSPYCKTLLVGQNRFDGLGTGGVIATARMTANDIQSELRKNLKEAETSLAIVVTGIGGGTGSTITPALLQAARSLSIPTMVFIVFPFSIEGSEKNKIANTAVKNICELADIYCFFKNDDLCGSLLSQTEVSLYDAMEESSEHIISGITMLWRLFKKPGYINLDLATLLSCTKKGRGQFYLSKGIAYGETRMQEVIPQLLSGNTGVNVHSNDIKHAIVGVYGGTDLRLNEISEIVSCLTTQLPQDTSIALGTAIDPTLDGSIEIITLLFKNWVEQYASIPETTIEHISKPTQAMSSIGDYKKIVTPQTNTNSPLCEVFRGTQGIVYRGENLDEPTYLRKRIPLSSI